MRAGSVVTRGSGGWWLVAALIATVVAASGCAGPVGRDELPGVYRSAETGAEIRLDADGKFSATDISEGEVEGRGSTDPIDFGGKWSVTPGNFVYLEVDGDGLSDIQLYTEGPKKAYLHPDPDGPVTLTLTRVAAP
ncbi:MULTISPECIES: hypothetical protein [unclassified Streptomyces]|uniref:hypothetical protein n=1 Tax=unclassified Streptomyces TaxID=2593676 RepID=UPI00202E8C7F|nr:MULTISPECIES: hypothetical protein [unclassified Streptomyces]MCM1973713.1 hypothetical protein [Streptomyces sp. G1]MCX5129252.1 hypothetical protein [Streptomyces sp. NBC_00347]